MYSKPNGSSISNINQLTADIVAVYLSRHDVSIKDLPALIASVQNALGRGETSLEMKPSLPFSLELKQPPAVPIEQSIEDDFLICLEDGRRFKSLKRHIEAQYSLTPEEYRRKWGLPYDYPMVAPSYAARRSSIAKGIGLGVVVSKRSRARVK